jgi:hypothetical protein
VSPAIDRLTAHRQRNLNGWNHYSAGYLANKVHFPIVLLSPPSSALPVSGVMEMDASKAEPLLRVEQAG